MKEAKKIHNLDTLEREIYRLKVEAKNIEEKLDRNLDHFQENCWSMTMNSFFCKDESKRNGENNFFKHEGLNTAINTIAGNIAGKATEGLHNWMHNFFGKNKH